MTKLLNISIDLTKVDKSKIIVGAKGKYLNLTIDVKDEKDQYDNDVSAWQSQSKEERQSGATRNYLGNGRILWSGQSQSSAQQSNDANAAAEALNDLL